MRNFAKLIIFFTLTFLILFVTVTCLKFLSLRVEWAKNLPAKPETALTLILAAASWAMSLTLFSSILISLNYVTRKKYFPLTSIACVMVLAFGFCFGISLALDQWKFVPPSKSEGIPLGDKGLILSNSLNRNLTSVVLLEGTANPFGPRVTSIPGLPLAYHETTSENIDLPPVPFGDDSPWFIKSFSIDIRMNAEFFQRKFSEGFFHYLLHLGSFIILLCALGYAIKFSVWSLANLFLAAIAFRGVYTLGTFFNSPEMQETISSFLNDRIPVTLALPLLFVAFSLLVHLYSFLVYIAKRKLEND